MSWIFHLCPEEPDYKINWDALLNYFPILEAMEGVNQNQKYHKEGNVLNHTKLVVGELVKSSGWRQLSEEKRSVLFLSALFHDIGKIIKTKEEDDEITSKGHASAGARLVRKILSDCNGFKIPPVPWEVREKVSNYIMLHMLPYFLLEKPDPLYSITAASQVVDNYMLEILCEADSKGRITDEYTNALEALELFGEFCQEHDCLYKPKLFKSSNARFRYFFERKGHPDLDRFEKINGTAFLMSGVAGVGKDTFISKLNKIQNPIQNLLCIYRQISLDDVRKELKIKATDKSGTGKVLNQAKEYCREEMRLKNDFVFNATNTNKQTRAKWIRLFRKYGYRVEIVYLEPTFKNILKQNKSRADSIPEDAIRSMFKNLDVPSLLECHKIHYQTY